MREAPAAAATDDAVGSHVDAILCAHPAELASFATAAMRQPLARQHRVSDDLAVLPWHLSRAERDALTPATRTALAAYEAALAGHYAAGRERNPAGRTGRTGRGRLPRLGSNAIALVLVTRLRRADEDRTTREGRGLLEVLVSVSDRGWVLPGRLGDGVGLDATAMSRLAAALRKRRMARDGWQLARMAALARQRRPAQWLQPWRLFGVDCDAWPVSLLQPSRAPRLDLASAGSPLRRTQAAAGSDTAATAEAQASQRLTLPEDALQTQSSTRVTAVLPGTSSSAAALAGNVAVAVSPDALLFSGSSSAVASSPALAATPLNHVQRRLQEASARGGTHAATDYRRQYRRQYEQR